MSAEPLNDVSTSPEAGKIVEIKNINPKNVNVITPGFDFIFCLSILLLKASRKNNETFKVCEKGCGHFTY